MMAITFRQHVAYLRRDITLPTQIKLMLGSYEKYVELIKSKYGDDAP